jgi:hypothetical protein
MNDEDHAQICDWLSRLAAELKVDSDTRLADYLNVPRQTLVKFRSRTEDLPVFAKLVLLDQLGELNVTDTLLLIVNESTRKKFKEWRAKHGRAEKLLECS